MKIKQYSLSVKFESKHPIPETSAMKLMREDLARVQQQAHAEMYKQMMAKPLFPIEGHDDIRDCICVLTTGAGCCDGRGVKAIPNTEWFGQHHKVDDVPF